MGSPGDQASGKKQRNRKQQRRGAARCSKVSQKKPARQTDSAEAAGGADGDAVRRSTRQSEQSPRSTCRFQNSPHENLKDDVHKGVFFALTEDIHIHANLYKCNEAQGGLEPGLDLPCSRR